MHGAACWLPRGWPVCCLSDVGLRWAGSQPGSKTCCSCDGCCCCGCRRRRLSYQWRHAHAFILHALLQAS
jgi:hypothetical protein